MSKARGRTMGAEPLDVMLVNPMFNRVFFDTPFMNVPLGLEYMQRALRDEDYKTRICNLDYREPGKRTAASNRRLQGKWIESRESLELSRRRVEDRKEKWWLDYEKTLKIYSPRVIGIGMVTPQYHAACMAARIAKEILPEVKTVAGGIHCTVMPEETLASGLFDAVAISEGEKTIVRLADCFIGGAGSIGEIKGICYNDGGKTVRAEPVDLVKNLDDLEFPARDCIVPPDTFHHTVKYSAAIITSRGCPFKCAFCARPALWMHNKVRFRSIENIIEEIRFLKKKYELSYFYILDDTFNISEERVSRFCDAMISAKTGLKWYCYMRADGVNDRLVRLMKRAGLDWVYLGGESGAQEILDRMKRNIRVEQVRAAAETLKRHGVGFNCSFIAGHPDETPETLARTESLIHELPADKTMVYFMAPYPGSEIFDNLKAADAITTYDWFLYNMYYPSLIRRDGITDRQLAGAVMRIYDYLNARHGRARKKLLNPAYLVEKMKTVRSASRLRHLVGRFFEVLSEKH